MKKEILFQLDIAWQLFEYHCHIKSTQESDNGSKVKSSHKLRKTCVSNLFKNGASEQQCSDYLGNYIEIFQRNYCFYTDTDEAMRMIVESV